MVAVEGQVVGIRGREGDGPEREFRATVVVGADGFHSTVAKKVGAELYNVRPAAASSTTRTTAGSTGDCTTRPGSTSSGSAPGPPTTT
ncbi:FAD-dependent monooxygenase [Actinomadura keratinilytica]